MKKFIHWAGTLTLVTASACSSMSKEECEKANWNELGRANGAAGGLTAEFDRRAESCSEKGVSADRAAFEAGRAEGLKTYCTPENGETLGRHGRDYGDVCPKELEPAFLEKYKPAFAGWMKKNRKEIEREIDQKESEIRKLKSEANGKRSMSYTLKGTKKSTTEREINSLESKIRSLESDVYGLKRKLNKFKD